MALINKEKVMNGVGKAVDVTNDAAYKISTFVKDNELDKKAANAAKSVGRSVVLVGEKAGEKISNFVENYKSK